jgi:glycosyltransferase involved in cell wall biosynthesis
MREVCIPAGASWELLVVNNNCTDDTDAVLERYRLQLPLTRLFEPTPGLSYARNTALAAARGTYLLWTDDDVLVEPEWVRATVAAFDRWKADLVFGRVLPWWEEGHPPPWYTPLFDGMFALLDFGCEPMVLRDRDRTGFGANHAFRTASLRALGGYRTDLGVVAGKGGGGEDLDIFHRARDAGMTVAYAPDAAVRHFIPAARCTKAYYRQYTWGGSLHHVRMLRDEAGRVPTVFGIPRYYYRTTIGHVGSFVAAAARGDRGRAFFHELKIIRFIGVLCNLVRK